MASAKIAINSKINLAEAIKLRYINKLSLNEIARYYDTSKQAVSQRLNSFLSRIREPEEIEAYVQNKSMLLSNAEMVLLDNMLDPSKLERAGTNQLAYAFQNIHTANRLESGKSTANICYADLRSEYERLRKIKEGKEGGESPAKS